MYKKGVILYYFGSKNKKQRSYALTENGLVLLYCILNDFIQRFIRAVALIPAVSRQRSASGLFY